MAPTHAQRALQSVATHIASLKAACTHQEECSGLVELLEASTPVLQHWEQSTDSIHNDRLKAAGQLLRFALQKVSRVAGVCANEQLLLDPTDSSNSTSNNGTVFTTTTASVTAGVDVPAEAAGAAADIQLAVSALATALQHHSQSGQSSSASGRTSLLQQQHLSTAACRTGLLADAVVRMRSSTEVSTPGSPQRLSTKTAGKQQQDSPFGRAASASAPGAAARAMHAGSTGAAARRRRMNSSCGGGASGASTAQRRTSSSSGGGGGGRHTKPAAAPARQQRNSGPAKQLAHGRSNPLKTNSSNDSGGGATASSGSSSRVNSSSVFLSQDSDFTEPCEASTESEGQDAEAAAAPTGSSSDGPCVHAVMQVLSEDGGKKVPSGQHAAGDTTTSSSDGGGGGSGGSHSHSKKAANKATPRSDNGGDSRRSKKASTTSNAATAATQALTDTHLPTAQQGAAHSSVLALQAVLRPGSKWRLTAEGGGFVCEEGPAGENETAAEANPVHVADAAASEADSGVAVTEVEAATAGSGGDGENIKGQQLATADDVADWDACSPELCVAGSRSLRGSDDSNSRRSSGNGNNILRRSGSDGSAGGSRFEGTTGSRQNSSGANDAVGPCDASVPTDAVASGSEPQSSVEHQHDNSSSGGGCGGSCRADTGVINSSFFGEPYALLQTGNAAYTAGRYAAAAKTYQTAVDVLQQLGVVIDASTATTAPTKSNPNTPAAGVGGEEGMLLWIKCSLNLACCHFRQGLYRACVAQCDSLLEVDPGNAVALCHRGRALLKMQQHDAARSDLCTAMDLLQQQQQKQDGGGGSGASSSVATVHNTALAAHIELNGSYWEQRIRGLLASMPA